MNTLKRLDYFLAHPQNVLDIDTPIIFVSDAHRNCGDKADDYAQNEEAALLALNFYYNEGYTLVEPGDGDDIWECEDYDLIKKAHPKTFEILNKFQEAHRYFPVAGNHNRELGDPEAILIKHRGIDVLVIHGHQGDFWNDKYWKIGRWFTRNVWRKLQWLGFKDPTTAIKEKNLKKHLRTEALLKEWANTRKHWEVSGHIHFQEMAGFFLSCGSVVRPNWGLEGVELKGMFNLVRWTKTGRLVIP